MKIMAIVDRHGLPLSVTTHVAKQMFDRKLRQRQQISRPVSDLEMVTLDDRTLNQLSQR